MCEIGTCHMRGCGGGGEAVRFERFVSIVKEVAGANVVAMQAF